jgi:hypothetical protein
MRIQTKANRGTAALCPLAAGVGKMKWRPFSWRLNDAVKQFPGVAYRGDELGKGWWVFPLELEGEIRGELTRLGYKVELLLQERPAYKPKKLPSFLKPHQIEPTQEILKRRRLIVDIDTRLGKTYMTIAALMTERAKRALIVVPAMVRLHWFEKLEELWTKSPPLCLVDTYEKAESVSSGPIVAVASYNTLTRMEPQGWGAIVADESHTLSSPVSLRSISIAAMLDKSPEALALFLSATPMTNEQISVHNQLDLLWDGRFGTAWQYSFRYANHVENEHRPGGLDFEGVNNEHLPELKKRLAAVSVRLSKDDVDPGLFPPLVTDSIRIPAVDVKRSPKFRKGALEAYCRRVGQAKASFTAERARSHATRYDRVMVTCYFHETADKLVKALQRLKPDRPVYLVRGDVTVAKRDKILKLAMKQRCFVVGTMMSINTGIDLSAFDCVVVGELYKSLHAMTQLMGRFQHMDKKDSTYMEFLVLEASHDEDIVNVLMRRAEDIGTVKHKGSEQKVKKALGFSQADEESLLARITARLSGEEVEEL